MVHLSNVRHGPPRSVEIKEPHIVVVSGPIAVDVEIADVGIEIVGGSRDILARFRGIPNCGTGRTRSKWTLLLEGKKSVLQGRGSA